MNLSPRLQIIANHVPMDSICADIGTDHAHVPIYLIKNNICQKVIATDINTGPLEIAREQIKTTGYKDFIETRLGNGLEPLRPGEVDCVVIAGMGGLLIKEILESSLDVVKNIKTFILQPMIAQRELRQYLVNNNLAIVDEDLAQEEQRVYEILIVKHGKQRMEEDIYYEIPLPLIRKRHPLLRPLIDRKKYELKKIIDQCEGKKTRNAENRIVECMTKLRRIEEVEKCL